MYERVKGMYDSATKRSKNEPQPTETTAEKKELMPETACTWKIRGKT